MIELPKDAEGREIPLDTVSLYDDSGNVYSIRRFIYTNDFDLGDKLINSWIAVVDDYKTVKPEQMYLTSPDSWEKLEDDLERARNKITPACWYACPDHITCKSCRFGKTLEWCTSKMVADILSRIRKLSGED